MTKELRDMLIKVAKAYYVEWQYVWEVIRHSGVNVNDLKDEDDFFNCFEVNR